MGGVPPLFFFDLGFFADLLETLRFSFGIALHLGDRCFSRSALTRAERDVYNGGMPTSRRLPPDIDDRLIPTFAEADAEVTLRTLGLAGALLRSRAERHLGTSGLGVLFEHRMARVSYPAGREVVALTDRGRAAHLEVAGVPAEYVERPSALVTRAYQVEVLLHLRTRWEVVGRRLKASPGLPRAREGAAPRRETDQVLAYHVRPLSMSGTVAHAPRGAVWSPGDPPLPMVARARDGEAVDLQTVPLLYCLGADGPVGMAAVRRLAREHRAAAGRWGRPLLIAVPEMTAELLMGMAAMQRRTEPGYVPSDRAPRLIQVHVPELVVVPFSGPDPNAER